MAGNVFHFEYRLADDIAGALFHGVKAVLQLAADHQAYDVVVIHFADHSAADAAAVFHHRVAVADAAYFRQLVRDINNGGALFTQLVHDQEQIVHLFVGQRGGRLIHDQHFGVEHQRFGYFQHLLMADGEIHHLFV